MIVRIRFKISLIFFGVLIFLFIVGFFALMHSFSNWKPAYFTIGEPGDAIWVTFFCFILSIPISLISLGFGLSVVRKRPLALLWVIPTIIGYILFVLLSLALYYG